MSLKLIESKIVENKWQEVLDILEEMGYNFSFCYFVLRKKNVPEFVVEEIVPYICSDKHKTEKVVRLLVKKKKHINTLIELVGVLGNESMFATMLSKYVKGSHKMLLKLAYPEIDRIIS